VVNARSESNSRGPKMTDVARLAGLSHQTVSRVVNNRANVRPTTRARVLAAIQELQYRPNSAARALVTGRSQTLGVVTFNSTLHGPASTLYGIEQAARDSHYFITVATLRSTDHACVRQAISRLVDQGVDGILVIAPLESVARALGDLPAGLPVVAVEGDADAEIDTVTVDQYAGARAATEHLLQQGHTTVWHVAGPQDWFEARHRLAGWQAALEEVGAEVPQPLYGDWTPKSGFAAGRVLARMPEVTAVFAANDSMALGVLRALHDHGRQVPGHVSLIGFDDLPEVAYLTPRLTTVRQDFAEVGRRGLALLVEQIESEVKEPRRVVVAATLVIRDSTRQLERSTRRSMFSPPTGDSS
jgi:DNA-binding LacI/PurR family transcriptional regulator